LILFPTGTVRDFKRRHKLGRFAPDADKNMPGPDEYAAEAELISVGQRCEVAPPGASDEGSEAGGMMMKRGVVKYVGQVAELKPGWWIGVEYDEPVGKHDGRWVVRFTGSVLDSCAHTNHPQPTAPANRDTSQLATSTVPLFGQTESLSETTLKKTWICSWTRTMKFKQALVIWHLCDDTAGRLIRFLIPSLQL
jgi:hypothetical protein